MLNFGTRLIVTALLSSFFASLSVAAPQEDEPFTERVIYIQSPSDPRIRYETTVFHPRVAKNPIAPIVLLNHGTSNDTRAERYRPTTMAAYFAEHGSPMIVPMRRGYANSAGQETKVENCDLTNYYLKNAKDVEEFVSWIGRQSIYQGRKIIMIGQSTGGGATMAYSSLPSNRAAAILNFHGGNRPTSATDCKWNQRIRAFARFAPTSKPTSLWIYTANDRSSNPPYIRALYQAFTRAGGNSRLVQLPTFKGDGHFLLIDPDGREIWEPIVTKYLHDMNVIRARK